MFSHDNTSDLFISSYRKNSASKGDVVSSDVNKDWTCKDKDKVWKGQRQGPNLQGPGQGQGLKFSP